MYDASEYNHALADETRSNKQTEPLGGVYPPPLISKKMPDQVRYVHPDKLYVVRNAQGIPTILVQTKSMAEFFAGADGGDYVLVPWYKKEDFDSDFQDKNVVYDAYIPSWKNPGQEIYAPIRRPQFDWRSHSRNRN